MHGDPVEAAGGAGGAPAVALAALIDAVDPPDAAISGNVEEHLNALTKPPGSLGRLEHVALRLALIYGDPPPRLERKVIYVLAGDHGVTQNGVSAYPAAVTAQMCRNFAAGGAAVCAIAGSVGAEIRPADLGVDADLDDVDGLVHAKVRRGTRDFTRGPALTDEEAVRAVLAGAALVQGEIRAPDVVALGEMGIGNTASASALTAVLTGAPAGRVVGPGTGVDRAGLIRKLRAVELGVGSFMSTRRGHERDPGLAALEALAWLGGLEIAGLVGVALAAAAARKAVIIDGFISAAAALVAVRLCPAAHGYLFAGHRSTEPGHDFLLEALGLEPILELGMRLGEGTGAALSLPVLDAAGAILREMATFASTGVSGRAGEAAQSTVARAE